MKQRSITSFFSPKTAKKPINKEPFKDVSAQQLNEEPMEIVLDDEEHNLKKPLNVNPTTTTTITTTTTTTSTLPVIKVVDDEENPFSRNSSTPSTRKRVIIESDDEEESENSNINDSKKKQTTRVGFTSPNPLLKAATTPMAKRLAQFANSSPGGSEVFSSPVSIGSSKALIMSSPSHQSSPQSSVYLSPSMASSNKMDEERYSWLLNVKDGQGNLAGSPDYDPRTLFIPSQAWNKFTPFERQFWEIKSKHFDTVVFFKKGKFYELYEQDADIGMKEFDLKMTDRVNMRMVGVPEASFSFWAAKFVAAGYKVARVDQMETAIGKSIREKTEKSSKEDKIIKRELTCILTAGTLVDSKLLSSDLSTYCMAIKEFSSSTSKFEYGIAFVDTATASFHLCSIIDDEYKTKLETLLVQIQPREVVFCKRHLSLETIKWMKNILAMNTIWNSLLDGKEFWDSDKTLLNLEKREYFKDFPEAIEKLKQDSLVISALGALTHYLTHLKLDQELISLSNFHLYDPVSQGNTLVLDGATLQNLEVFQTNVAGQEDKGTLFELLDHCVTPFGRRMFKKWVCYPLRSISEIEGRLDAVDELSNYRDDLTPLLSKYMDLERSLSRVHAGTCKLNDFLSIISAFEYTKKIKSYLNDNASSFQTKLLKDVVQGFPDYDDLLEPFVSGFDHALARKEGSIIPNPGVETEYDEAVEKIKSIEKGFSDHLKKHYDLLKTKDIRYKDIGKEIFQLEVPASVIVPDDYIVMSKTKAYKRYWNQTIRSLVKEYQEAKEICSGILNTILQRMQAKFDAHYRVWMKIVDSLSLLDCLLCLVTCRYAIGEPCCRPTWIQNSEGGSQVNFKDLRHPCVSIEGGDFIPNDVVLGRGDGKRMTLLTGPNMGGKSTLLRQTCIAIILGQLGCYVPASSCEMTPIDRIFTRIGAHDHIMAGQSTFMVELSETSKILRESTSSSLVILDELGRGTSTFDGYAIAFAVLHYLANCVGCLGLFATHYRQLTIDFASHKNIKLSHMACKVDDQEKKVTFLYRLKDGVCPKSYGMNVAAMAGLPRELIDNAEQVADDFEKLQHEYYVKEDGDADLGIERVQDFEFLKALSNGTTTLLAQGMKPSYLSFLLTSFK